MHHHPIQASASRETRLGTKTKILAASLLGAFVAASAQAIVVSVSTADSSAARDGALASFLSSNFSNITTLNVGYYNTAAAVPAGTDLLIIGRRIFSGDFGNATNSAAFNALTIPVVSLTSYVSRVDGSRWGWHNGPVVGGQSINGDETTITAAGATAFGAAGVADWWGPLTGGGLAVTPVTTFNALGSGSVGQGDVLASINGSVLVAHWNAGELSGTNVAFGGDRLLFNMPDYDNSGGIELPNTPAGQAAFIAALDTYTPLVANAIPEPSSTALLMGAAAMGMMATRRRRQA